MKSDKTAISDGIPTFTTFEGDIYFRHQDLDPSEWITHSHPWGQFNYVSQGVMHLEILGERFISPKQYAVWIPPNFEHASFNKVASTYRTAYLSIQFSSKLPSEPCALSVSDLLKEIFEEFARLDVQSPKTRQEVNMARVALDQIESSDRISDFLPYPSSEELHKILDYVQSNLHEKRSTSEIAANFFITSRTLERKCQTELGIGFGEWQKRLRLTQAIELLDSGATIKQISWDIGYSSPSVFITMFRRYTGMTPDEYRKNKG